MGKMLKAQMIAALETSPKYQHTPIFEDVEEFQGEKTDRIWQVSRASQSTTAATYL